MESILNEYHNDMHNCVTVPWNFKLLYVTVSTLKPIAIVTGNIFMCIRIKVDTLKGPV